MTNEADRPQRIAPNESVDVPPETLDQITRESSGRPTEPETLATIDALKPIGLEWNRGYERPAKTVRVPHDIHVTREDAGVPRRFLAARAGDYVTPEEARELGIIPVESDPPPAMETK